MLDVIYKKMFEPTIDKLLKILSNPMNRLDNSLIDKSTDQRIQTETEINISNNSNNSKQQQINQHNYK